MKQQTQPQANIRRNLFIFTAAVLGSGWLGLALARAMGVPDRQEGLGLLPWLLLPVVTGLLLRAFAGDGWQDAGFRPHLQSGGPWYIVALLSFPLISLLTFALGSMVGALSAPGIETQGWGAFVALMAASFVPMFIKNIFEEFAWRGYLTPRFAALGLHPLLNHLLTGLIWGCWHIPYWLYFVDTQQNTPLPVPTFIVLTILTMVITAITYGELRLLSGSVWPLVLLHTVANVITIAARAGFVSLNGVGGAIFTPEMVGLLHALLTAILGLGLYYYRVNNPQSQSQRQLMEVYKVNT